MPRYWIPDHVHVCITQKIVWLDRRKNKYLSMPAAASRYLVQLVHGWPPCEDETDKKSPISEATRDALVSQLMARELLAEHMMNARRFKSARIEAPRESIDIDPCGDAPKIRLSHLLRFSSAYAITGLLMRFGGLDFAITRLEERTRRAAEGAPDEERIAELVIVFRSLRRLFYTAKDRCLFDSMVMTRFLHSYGVAHSLVIGVTAEPLTAHSWLQHGGVVLNCDAEIACRFRPILVV